MYLDFFNFSAPPFELTPDPRFLYLPPGHQEALSTLEYGVMSGKGLTLLTGEAGMGKTTLLTAALGQLHGVATRVIRVSNPALTRPEFIEVIARSLDPDQPAGASKPAVLHALETALRRDRDSGTRAVLIADEAHVMPDELLEEIRLLGNFETSSAKLLSIILVGQPELAERLNEPSLRQLKQRVALRCGLAPFSEAETAAYVDTRLRVVGRSMSETFSVDAIMAIHACSRGIPRLINVLCDNALLTAFAADQRIVSVEIIEEVRKDFDLEPVQAEISETAAAPKGEPIFVATLAAREYTGAAPELVAAAPAPPRPRPAPAAAVSKTRPRLAAERDSKLFTIYTRPKGFFSRVFS